MLRSLNNKCRDLKAQTGAHAAVGNEMHAVTVISADLNNVFYGNLLPLIASDTLENLHVAGVVLHVKNMAQTAAHGNGEDNVRNFYNLTGNLMR